MRILGCIAASLLLSAFACSTREHGVPHLRGPAARRLPPPAHVSEEARRLVRGTRVAGRCRYAPDTTRLRSGDRRLTWVAEVDTAACEVVFAWTSHFAEPRFPGESDARADTLTSTSRR
jgi:hypothetical protein